jgi:hypothetical protein
VGISRAVLFCAARLLRRFFFFGRQLFFGAKKLNPAVVLTSGGSESEEDEESEDEDDDPEESEGSPLRFFFLLLLLFGFLLFALGVLGLTRSVPCPVSVPLSSGEWSSAPESRTSYTSLPLSPQCGVRRLRMSSGDLLLERVGERRGGDGEGGGESAASGLGSELPLLLPLVGFALPVLVFFEFLDPAFFGITVVFLFLTRTGRTNSSGGLFLSLEDVRLELV